jgi:hypothetical protein
MTTLDDLTKLVGAPLANSTDPTKGSALVGHEGGTAKQALDSLNSWMLVPTVGAVRSTPNRFTDREVSLDEFYLAGYTDDQAWNAALSYCAASNKSLYVPYQAGGYTWTTPKVWNNHAHGVRCEPSVTINASGITGYALSVQGLFSDASGTQQAYQRPWRGGQLYGSRTTGQHGIFFGASSGTTLTGGLATFQNFVLHDFDTGRGYGNNAFQNAFSQVVTYNCNLADSFPGGASNSGENISFHQCQFLNSTNVCSAAGPWFLNYIDCSFDYFSNSALSISGGAVVNVFGGHAEASSNASYWFSVSGANSKLTIRNLMPLVTASSRTIELFYSDPSCLNGGLDLDNLHLIVGQGVYTPQFLVAGTGRVTSRNITWNQVGSSGPVSQSANLLSVGSAGFETNTDGWTLTELGGGPVPARSTDYAHSGTYSLKFATGNGQTTTASLTLPCKPGETPIISFYLKLIGVAAAGVTFYVVWNFLDAAGTNIGNGSTHSYTADQDWTIGIPNTFATTAPQGTAAFFIQFTTGSWSSSAFAYLDDVAITGCSNPYNVGLLQSVNNLSDVASPATALANLGGLPSTTPTITGATITGGTINGTSIGQTTPAAVASTFFSQTTSGSTSGAVLTDTGSAGANLKMVGNGATTPSKTIRVISGNWQLVNSAYNGVILTVGDTGNMFAGQCRHYSSRFWIKSCRRNKCKAGCGHPCLGDRGCRQHFRNS